MEGTLTRLMVLTIEQLRKSSSGAYSMSDLLEFSTCDT